MQQAAQQADAVVVGGGFYGSVIASYLARERGLRRVVLVEQETGLLRRASYTNQARVHNGYHYPRSFTTAYRSRVNQPKFVQDWADAIYSRFTKLYAIARQNSKVSARQFERFCASVGAELQAAPQDMVRLFSPRLIEQVYLAEERAFDTTRLAAWAERTLAQAGVLTRLGSRVSAVHPRTTSAAAGLQVLVQAQGRAAQPLHCRYLLNCTYSGINQLAGDFPQVTSGVKHELTEMACVRFSGPLAHIGVTVMDGPFFSMMPFPAKGLHSLSHVRYTPRTSWTDAAGIDPYARLAQAGEQSRYDHMLRDVARYMPQASQACYEGSMFEVKTVLTSNEVDDGRPILFEKHAALPGCYSVLGAKLDNIYDVLERLNDEPFVGETPCTMH